MVEDLTALAVVFLSFIVMPIITGTAIALFLSRNDDDRD